MKLSVFILVSLSAASVCYDLPNFYGSKTLFPVTPENQQNLLQLSSYLLQVINVFDLWTNSANGSDPVDASGRRQLFDDFLAYLNSGGVGLERIMEDLGKIFVKDAPTTFSCNAQPPYDFFCTFRSYNKINQFLNDLVSANPGLISMEKVGTSYEGRSMYAFRISKRSDTKKPVIWIQGGQHAWEQAGPAVATYLALELSILLKSDTEFSELLDTFDWYILPVVNPDGYEYAQNVDRFWRKTRSHYPNERNCTGVDPNRNWDIHWNDNSGSSSDPCSIFYAGPAAFSEPETRAISQYMLNNFTGPLKLFIDFHTYSQRWMSPYGYTHDLPRNYAEQNRVSTIAVAAAKEVYGSEYKVGSSGNILYTVAGGTRDWAYDVMNATFSYVVEMRDTGEYGFLLPRNQILPTGEEIWAGIKAMGRELVKLEHKQN